MSVHRSSRYLRQPKLQIVDDKGNTNLVYEQRDTTVFEADLPAGTHSFVPNAGNSFPSLARSILGRQQFWWIIADCNPDIFYPLDYEDGIRVNAPPKTSLLRFQKQR